MALDDHKKFIQQGFDTVANGYDHPSLFFFPQTADKLIELLDLKGDEQLLDVCTGTGMVSVRAAEKLPNGHVTGIDLSQGMLDVARAKAEAKGINNLELVQMDLEQLSLENLNRTTPFDIATCSFGLFFVEDMTSALQNIKNCVSAMDGGNTGYAGKQLPVKEGGKIAITTFANDAFSPFSDIFIEDYEATGRDVPKLSWKRLATEELIREQFAEVGITEVDIHHNPMGKQLTDEQQWWDVVWNAGWRALLSQMGEAEQTQFSEYHRNHIKQVVGDDGEWFNTEVLVAIGHI